MPKEALEKYLEMGGSLGVLQSFVGLQQRAINVWKEGAANRHHGFKLLAFFEVMGCPLYSLLIDTPLIRKLAKLVALEVVSLHAVSTALSIDADALREVLHGTSTLPNERRGELSSFIGRYTKALEYAEAALRKKAGIEEQPYAVSDVPQKVTVTKKSHAIDAFAKSAQALLQLARLLEAEGDLSTRADRDQVRKLVGMQTITGLASVLGNLSREHKDA